MISTTRHALAGLLAIAVAGSLLGCSNENPLDLGDSSTDSSITVGSQDSSQSEILAQLYGQVLADAGYDVDYNLSIGDRSSFFTALAVGAIDLVPDYSGEVLYTADSSAAATSAPDIAAALPAALEAMGLRPLNAAEAEDGPALVVTPEFSVANNILSIGDLAVLGSAFTIGAATGFEEGVYGRAALERVYGVTGFAFAPVDDLSGAQLLQELLGHKIQVADISGASPAITQNGLVVLEDPQDVIPAQSVVPILDADIYSDTIADLLNPVTAKLTTVELRALDAAYYGDTKPSAASIATAWLTANGFLAPVTP